MARTFMIFLFVFSANLLCYGFPFSEQSENPSLGDYIPFKNQEYENKEETNYLYYDPTNAENVFGQLKSVGPFNKKQKICIQEKEINMPKKSWENEISRNHNDNTFEQNDQVGSNFSPFNYEGTPEISRSGNSFYLGNKGFFGKSQPMDKFDYNINVSPLSTNNQAAELQKSYLADFSLDNNYNRPFPTHMTKRETRQPINYWSYNMLPRESASNPFQSDFIYSGDTQDHGNFERSFITSADHSNWLPEAEVKKINYPTYVLLINHGKNFNNEQKKSINTYIEEDTLARLVYSQIFPPNRNAHNIYDTTLNEELMGAAMTAWQVKIENSERPDEFKTEIKEDGLIKKNAKSKREIREQPETTTTATKTEESTNHSRVRRQWMMPMMGYGGLGGMGGMGGMGYGNGMSQSQSMASGGGYGNNYGGFYG